jgi:hypothetical protein
MTRHEPEAVDVIRCRLAAIAWMTSVVTANPAIEGHFKTGHRAAART